MNNTEIQRYLRDKNLYRGEIDGMLGPQSREAMRQLLGAYQWSNRRLRLATEQMMCSDAGIPPGPIDGIMGPKTRGALSLYEAERDGRSTEPAASDPLAKSVEATMPWLERAQHLVGTREIKGKRHNPVIMGWAEAQKIWYPSDEIAWCGLLNSHCFHYALPNEPQPENPLGARQWLTFGIDCVPQLGAVLVFYRGERSGWMGHTGQYVGEDSTAYHVLGGNQDNAVNVKRVAKRRFLGARWPELGGDPPGIIRRLDRRGRLSTNEA